MSKLSWPDSLWAAVTPPGPDARPLDGDAKADAVVIGAGFTGLAAALHLAGTGADVLVLEAVAPGWGASGRSNGQVIPTLTRPDPDAIVAQLGEAGERFVAMLRDSASLLFDLVRSQGIDAEAEQTGWMQPVHTPGRMKIAEQRVAQWSKWGAPVELLTREDVRAMSGSDLWHGGFWNRSGGHVNPLALARGLARAVAAKGGRIAVQTPATACERLDGRWIVRTPRGKVTAKALVLATNAYTGEIAPHLAPRIARQVVPVLSWQMATRPLGEDLRRIVMPGRQALSDTHGDLHFCRYDARNRLVTGGALIVPVNGAERLRRRIGDRLRRMFPEIGSIGFDHVWNGYIGMTTDFLPRVHRLGPDGFAWVGCNGRAVALAIALGREIARAIAGVPVAELGLPLTEPRPLAAHRLLRRLAPLRLAELRWRDAREVR
ncbi:MAG: FAD-binding oxidoreductase [Hyphomicrobiaceae bacterium]|nr:FAD-binding oxidoreductase [Hyphomicrobiaceae bacterium]